MVGPCIVALRSYTMILVNLFSLFTAAHLLYYFSLSKVADLDGIDANELAAQHIERPRLNYSSTSQVQESKEEDRATQEDLAALEAELDVSQAVLGLLADFLFRCLNLFVYHLVLARLKYIVHQH